MPSFEQARNWYPRDPVHGFDHVLRVYRLAEKLAQAEGADLEIVRAAVLFHDVESYTPKESERRGVSGEMENKPGKRKNHHLSAAEFAAHVLYLEGWEENKIEAVCHCIRAHRFRDQHEQPQTIEAQVVFDADKLDAIGATGVARAIAYATRADMPAFAAPSQQFIDTGALEPGEPHSAYHEHIFKLMRIKDRLFTPAGRRMAEERHRFMCEYFDRLAKEWGSVQSLH